METVLIRRGRMTTWLHSLPAPTNYRQPPRLVAVWWKEVLEVSLEVLEMSCLEVEVGLWTLVRWRWML